MAAAPIKKLNVSSSPGQETTREHDSDQQKYVFLRQPGEPLLWFNRFLRFKRLGAKRTLMAALMDERASVQVLRGTGSEQEPEADASQPTRRRKKKRGTSLSVVPDRPAPTQVPGSWKRASIEWRWIERAQAWDNYIIELCIERHWDALLDGASVGVFRVEMLKNLLQSVTNDYNRTSEPHQRVALAARIQSVLAQIAQEMEALNEPLARVAVRTQTEATYQLMTAEDLRAWKNGQAYTPPGRNWPQFT